MAKRERLYKSVEQIKVYIWDQYVGALALDPQLGFYAFAYDRKFGNSGIELSPIHMPLTNTEQPYIFTDLPESTYKRLPALLADALPDDFGNALVDKYMSEKGVLKSQITPLDRLAYTGRRGMGALEFKPSRGPAGTKSFAIELNQLVLEARSALKGSFDSDQAIAALQNLIEVGTSAGGARAKAVIAWNPSTKEIQSGQLDAPAGFEHWLLKFDGLGEDLELGYSQNYGRIEYVYYQMAKDAGIRISECQLLHENGRTHFMTKRFDRAAGNVKHHIQTLCAMDHIDYKKSAVNSYEQYFLVIRQLKLGHDAEVEAFRRMVFNVMGRNCDDHTKNFSFLLRKGGPWELAPAYDICFAYNPNGEWTNQHLMSVNGKYKNINLADLQAVANRFGIGEFKSIVKSVRSALEKWPDLAENAGVQASKIEKIQSLHLLLE